MISPTYIDRLHLGPEHNMICMECGITWYNGGLPNDNECSMGCSGTVEAWSPPASDEEE